MSVWALQVPSPTLASREAFLGEEGFSSGDWLVGVSGSQDSRPRNQKGRATQREKGPELIVEHRVPQVGQRLEQIIESNEATPPAVASHRQVNLQTRGISKAMEAVMIALSHGFFFGSNCSTEHLVL